MLNCKLENQDTYRRCVKCGRIYLDDNCITEAVCPTCKISEPDTSKMAPVKWNILPDITE